jgi:hypothetical protein
MQMQLMGKPADVRFGSLADIRAANGHVRFTPESGHVRCNYRCPLWANSGHSALLTKAHSRSRKRLIGRLLNTAEHNGTNDRDGNCPNAGKDEGSHDRPSLCLRNGSIKISRKGPYSHCPKRRT